MQLHLDRYDFEEPEKRRGSGSGSPPKAPPLIILHGLFGAGINWRSMARRFSAYRRVYTFDLPNHGYSYHTDSLDYSSMAEAVAKSCEDLGIWQADFIGHSMGGKCAMRLAVDFPELPASLTVVDIGPGESPGDLSPLVEALTALDLSSVASRGDADQTLAKMIKDRRIRTFLLQNLRRDGEGTFRWRTNLPVIARDLDKVHGPVLTGREMELLQSGGADSLDPGLKALPALFLSGADSPYMDGSQQELARLIFPSATFCSIPGAGHWLHVDQPDTFFREVEGFLFPD